MNRTQMSFALMLSLVACVTGGVQAQRTASSAVQTSLHHIVVNAQAARDNAAIYQWQRVNLEVDRIVASEHAIEKALAADAGQKDKVVSLREAVSALRKARLNHDVEMIKSSAEKVLTAADALK